MKSRKWMSTALVGDSSASFASHDNGDSALPASSAPSPNARFESPTISPIPVPAALPVLTPNPQGIATSGHPIDGIEAKASPSDLPPARMADRAIAVLMDIVVTSALFPLVGMWAALRWGGVTPSGFELHGAAGFVTLFLVCTVWFLYSWLFEGLFGATLGKLAMNIRVRRLDGSAIGLRKSFIRNLLRLIDGIGVYLVGFLVAILSRRRQRLGDHVAGTVVGETTAGKSVRISAAIAGAAIIVFCLVGAFSLHGGAPAGATTTGGSPSATPGSSAAMRSSASSNAAQVTRAEMGTDNTADYEIIGPTTNFYTDTPKIVCVWAIQSNDASVPIKSVWIAEDVGDVAPPNYQLAEKSIAGSFEKGNFSINSPTNGFPVGKYRLDIYIGDKLARQIPFTITQR